MTQPPYGEQPRWGEHPTHDKQPDPAQSSYGQPWHPQPQFGQPGYPQPPYGMAPQYGGPPPYGHPMPRQTNGKAIGALVCGIASLVTCGLFLGIPAVVLGNLALGEIDEAQGMQDGRQLAIAGRLLGWVAIALMILGLLAALIVLIIAAASP